MEDNPSVSDLELIQKSLNNDLHAFELLMNRHVQKAYHIAYGVLGDNHDAEEVVQDSFVRIHRALSSFRGDSEFSTWMYRIVINQARNRFRWNKRRGQGVNISIDDTQIPNSSSQRSFDLPDDTQNPVDQISKRELHQKIYQEMMALPELNREALVLRNVHDMSYEQIAEVLDCKVGTVKSRIARARIELKKRLRL
ncbi:MAG: sigma-70 family RNA polymerase sigma factor [Lentisphaeria bacterium]|nr:sigma-70 family RNA polymerase sigma factor [Lentisphaeria bacterium]